MVRTRQPILMTFAVVCFLLTSCDTTNAGPSNTATRTPSLLPPAISTKTPTFTPTATRTITPTVTPIPTPTPFAGADSLLFGYWECMSTGCTPLRRIWDNGKAMRLNLETGEVAPIGDTGYMLEDVSPDGQTLLMSDWTNLYVTDLYGNNPILIATNLLDTPEIVAYWTQRGDIAFIGTDDSVNILYLVSPEGTNLRPITNAGMKPLALLHSQFPSGVIWEAGFIEGDRHYSEGLRISSFEGELLLELPNAWLLDISLGGDSLAYHETIYFQPEPGKSDSISSHWILDLTTLETREINIPLLEENVYVQKFKWTPDGQQAIVVLNICRPVGGGRSTCDEKRAILIDLNGNLIKELPEQFERWESWFWSPDGKLLLAYSMPSHDRVNFYTSLSNLNIQSLEIPGTSPPRYFGKEFDSLLYLKRFIWLARDPHPWNEVYQDDRLPAHIDIVSADYSITKDSLEITITLRDLPEKLPVNREGVCDSCWEYRWGAFVDNDNNRNTGGVPGLDVPVGWEYALLLVIDHGNGGQPEIQSISDRAFVEIWEVNNSGGWNLTISPQSKFQLDRSGNTITISGILSGISVDADLEFYAFDSNPDGRIVSDYFIPFE